jgi:hypothetical protein
MAPVIAYSSRRSFPGSSPPSIVKFPISLTFVTSFLNFSSHWAGVEVASWGLVGSVDDWAWR